jgi:hypothetical protein
VVEERHPGEDHEVLDLDEAAQPVGSRLWQRGCGLRLEAGLLAPILLLPHGPNLEKAAHAEQTPRRDFGTVQTGNGRERLGEDRLDRRRQPALTQIGVADVRAGQVLRHPADQDRVLREIAHVP